MLLMLLVAAAALDTASLKSDFRLQAARAGLIDPNANVVCLVTGSAFKDPAALDAMVQGVSAPLIELADLERRVREVT